MATHTKLGKLLKALILSLLFFLFLARPVSAENIIDNWVNKEECEKVKNHSKSLNIRKPYWLGDYAKCLWRKGSITKKQYVRMKNTAENKRAQEKAHQEVKEGKSQTKEFLTFKGISNREPQTRTEKEVTLSGGSGIMLYALARALPSSLLFFAITFAIGERLLGRLTWPVRLIGFFVVWIVTLVSALATNPSPAQLPIPANLFIPLGAAILAFFALWRLERSLKNTPRPPTGEG